MIISEKVSVSIGGKNMSHYKALGYSDIKKGDVINVGINELPPSTDFKIQVKCDVCGATKFLSLCNYNVNIKKYGIYSCSEKCSRVKAVKTMVETYGVDSYSKTEEYKVRTTNTCLEKYGVDNYFKTEECKQKIKDTCIKKYNVDNYSKTDEYKDKVKNTCLEKFGMESYSQTEKSRKNMSDRLRGKKFKDGTNEKIHSKLLEKYNSDCYFGSEKFKKEIKEKYGVTNISQNEEIKKKKEETCLKNFGVKHNAQNEEIFNKTQKSGFKRFLHEQTGLY